jgi:hypothetical protein
MSFIKRDGGVIPLLYAEIAYTASVSNSGHRQKVSNRHRYNSDPRRKHADSGPQQAAEGPDMG